MLRPISTDRVLYTHEYPQRVRTCFIGAGGHSYRNIYPTFRYAPVDLAAVCDLQPDRAAAYARQFGAERSYSDPLEMLEKEKPQAVFIVTSYLPDGRAQATDLALAALGAGAHVWTEKPPASSLEEIDGLIAASVAANRHVMVGLKKMFTPTVSKAKEIVGSPEFGGANSIYVRYPIRMPALSERASLPAIRSLFDHIFHPAAITQYLMGDVERMSYEWEDRMGSAVTTLRFRSGAVGILHFAGGSSGSAPLERVEVVGEGANLAIENGARLIYYRKSKMPEYGRSASFLAPDDTAPLLWEPERSLGQLYNSNDFLLGYAQEVREFFQCVLEDIAPVRGTLRQSREILKLLDAYRTGEPGTSITING